MTPPRFYTRDPLPPGEFILAGAEAHHLATVRRFVPGDLVTLFNGDGRDYPAEIVSADPELTRHPGLKADMLRHFRSNLGFLGIG